MMRTEEPRPVRLSEYRPPDWLVETVNLDVKLHPTQTPVRATFKHYVAHYGITEE